MAAMVLMPKVGITVETCLIGAWNKKVGDRVSAGDILFNYETDKAAFDCESTADGTLLEIFFGDGEEVPVLTPVCSVGEPDDAGRMGGMTPPATQDDAGRGGGVIPQDANGGQCVGRGFPDAPTADSNAFTSARQGCRALQQRFPVDVYYNETADSMGSDGSPPKISPRARKLAARLGVDASRVAPSGPYGRVIERDVLASLAGESGGAAQSTASAGTAASAEATASADAGAGADKGPAAAVGGASVQGAGGGGLGAQAETGAAGDYADVKLPKIRRVIAAAMTKSLTEIAQLTHHHSFDATNLLAVREGFKKGGKDTGMDGVTIGDIVLFAVARTLRDFPDFNAHYLEGGILRRFKNVNLGVAIDTERGLMVPTVFGADTKSLKQISAEVKELARSARAGSISPDKLTGGTFTVSNLGASGVEMFTPIINPPQVAILGVCGITARIRKAPGGSFSAYDSMGLSLTYDHRAVDGAPAAAFAQRLCAALEQLSLLL